MVQKELKVMGWNEGFVLWVMELLKDFKVGMMTWFPFRIVSISVDVVTMPVCPVDIPWEKKKKPSSEGGQRPGKGPCVELSQLSYLLTRNGRNEDLYFLFISECRSWNHNAPVSNLMF